MRYFRDGNAVCVVLDDFVNLQESPALFFPIESATGRVLQRDGVRGLPLGDLRDIREALLYGIPLPGHLRAAKGEDDA